MSDPLFFPRGVFPGEVPDPDEAAEEFIAAAQVASRTSQWSWLQAGITSRSLLQKGGMVKLEGPCGVAALLQTLPGIGPVLPDTGGANANLWKIPYNRGYSVIDGDNACNGVMRLSWTSTYPELILATYSMQYVRWDTSAATWATFFATAGRIPRVQTGIRIDGAAFEGTGPDAAPIDAKWRGQGLATKAAALSAQCFTILPPGPHTFEVIAAQASAQNSDEDTGESETYSDSGPTQGVCIGTRQGWVTRFALGAFMGA